MNPNPGLFRRTFSPRLLAGHLVVFTLSVIARWPLGVTQALGTIMLPLYLPFRRRTRATLRRHAPRVTPFSYYRMRLRLALLSIRHATNRPDGCRHHIENTTLFEDALATDRPIVLLGWHQGPVELLHKIPSSHLQNKYAGSGGERGFFLMTAGAFSPPLAEWMASGRQGGDRIPTRLIRPGDSAVLRDWVRTRGILAVMIDQVPGVPADSLTPGAGMPALPWPRRLVEWIMAQDVAVLAVSALWYQRGQGGGQPARDEEQAGIMQPEREGQSVIFRYDVLAPTGTIASADSIKNRIGALMDHALTQAPEQYNWSYGKIGRIGTTGNTGIAENNGA